jgi:hypothetical protein
MLRQALLHNLQRMALLLESGEVGCQHALPTSECSRVYVMAVM